MDFLGSYYDGEEGVMVSLTYEGKRIQAKVVKINRLKTKRRGTAKRQPGDAHNVRLTLFLPSGKWDQEVEEEHLTLLDGSRFETKNYACDALPARRRKATKRLLKEEGWQNGVDSGLARSGKKKPKRERLTPEAIDDLILYYCKESKSWWVACDKDPETDISRLVEDRDDYFYRSFGTGALEDLKWGQGTRATKGIRIVRRSRDAVTLEGEDKPLVFRLSGEMHDGEPVYRFLAGSSQRPRMVYYSHGPITMRGLSSHDRAYLVGLGFPLPPSEAEREAYDKRIHGKHLAGDRAATEAAEKRRLAAAYLAEAEALEARAEADRAA